MSETNWNDLARRCEEATGADYLLNVSLVMATYPQIGNPAPHCIGDEPIFWHDPYYKQPVPDLTASIDAITALIEREAGGCGWTIDRPMDAMSDFKPIGGITLDYRETPEGPECEHYSGQAATPALALCAAFARAMAHRSTPHE